MAQLHRIILLHTHLPGVVELDVSGHTNICGSNASGKTTLQRLVPVFYGEQPNRVVPKTRDRFDVFYLPHQNSYIIYEYEVNYERKHVVLTKRADGVDYRFVDAPYQSALYCNDNEQGIEVVDYPTWAQRLREAGIHSSAKISATSEYRAIIQNDTSGLRGQRKDQMRLRQLASRYALSNGSERLRHIEKLVSAVHAKEGKMDTLKSMLATILEEDGYERPGLSIKPVKIRAWVKEMRQFVGIDGIQKQYQAIDARRSDLAGVEALLWQLKPVVDEDRQVLRTDLADCQAQLTETRQQRDTLEETYRSERDTLTDIKHDSESKYQQLNRDLERAEEKRNRYLDSGIEALEQAVKSLPVWQQGVEEKGRHLALMLEKSEHIAQKLEQRKNQLADSLDRLQRKNQHAAEQLRQEQTALRERQADTVSRLQQAHMQAQQDAQTKLHQQLQASQRETASLQAQLEVEPLTSAEREEVQLADARIEALQDDYDVAQEAYARADQALQKAKQQRQDSDHALVQVRATLNRAEQHLQQLQRQLNPQQGSLRHFLREHQPGWQHTLGKIIAEPLLDRTDLNPVRTGDGSMDSCFGVQLDIGAIEQPGHAYDEAQIQSALAQATSQREQHHNELATAESELERLNQAVQEAEQEWQQARQRVRRLQQDLEYAREAKKRLHTEHHSLIKQRQQAHRERLRVLAEEEARLQEHHQQQVAAIRHDYKSLELEHRADFQEQLDKLDHDIAQLQRQVDDLRASNQQQIKELQKQVDQQLAAEGVDGKRVSELKHEIATLHDNIAEVKDRQHELSQYQDFMATVWVAQRPAWLDQQQAVKQALQDTQAQLTQLKRDYEAQRGALRAAEKQLQAQQSQYQQVSSQLDEQLQRFNKLLGTEPYEVSESVRDATDFGDLSERVERLTQALSEWQQCSSDVKDKCAQFARALRFNASDEFVNLIDREYQQFGRELTVVEEAQLLGELLAVLRDQRAQVIEQGRNIGGELQGFFKVFDNVNRKVGQYSRRLTDVVGDELSLEGIERSEVLISSTVDELGFWQPLQHFNQLYNQWVDSGERMPSEAYLDRLSEVADLLRSDQEYNFESLLKLELHLNERGSELIIRNDRQLLESSSHGMAYLILCKFLLAFTRLLRGESDVIIHWPIDEIGTLAYHNVERLFAACDSNRIHVVGAFPNPESDVLLLFKHRYLIEPHKDKPGKGQLKRIQPRVSPLSEKLAQKVSANEEAL